MKRNEILVQKKELKKILAKFNYPSKVKCVSKEELVFRITFNHRYLQQFSERAFDWVKYVLDNIHRFLLIHFNPRGSFSSKSYSLIHDKVMKPIHVKSSCMPICEVMLECKLKAKGYKIIEEYLEHTSTSYDVTKETNS